MRQKLQRLFEIGLGGGPALLPLEGDAAEVIQRPARFLRLGGGGQGLAIRFGGLDEQFARALQVAEGRQGVLVARIAGDELLQPARRLLLLAHRVEHQRGLHIGRAAHGRAIGDELVGVDGAFVLLQALVNLGQRHDGEVVAGRQEQGEAQIDHRRQFVALAAASGAEAVERPLGRALLDIAHHGVELAPGGEIGLRRIDQRMTRQNLRESGVGAPGLIRIAVPGHEAGVGVDEAQRVLLAVVGRLHALRRLGAQAADIGDERAVVRAEDGEGFLLELIDEIDGALGFARADEGPGRQQRRGEVALAAGAALAEMLARLLPLLRLDRANAEGEMREAVRGLKLEQALGERESGVEIAIGEIGDEGALDQLRVARIVARGRRWRRRKCAIGDEGRGIMPAGLSPTSNGVATAALSRACAGAAAKAASATAAPSAQRGRIRLFGGVRGTWGLFGWRPAPGVDRPAPRRETP